MTAHTSRLIPSYSFAKCIFQVDVDFQEFAGTRDNPAYMVRTSCSSAILNTFLTVNNLTAIAI